MKAPIRTFLLFLLLINLTSCFEIYERVWLNKNGSGQAELVLDLSKLKSTSQMIRNMWYSSDRDRRSEDDPVWSARTDFADRKMLLEGIDGISNCTLLEDTAMSIIGVRFEFASVDALNIAMNTIADRDSTQSNEEYFSLKKRVFDRTAASDFQELSLDEIGSGANQQTFLPLFEDLRYITEYTMPKKVKSVANENATLSLDRKTVFLSYDIIKDYGKTSIANSIRY